jgi:hypothetical protein
MIGSSDKRKAKFFALMARYNQIGALLPDPDDFDPHDAAALSEAKVILAEMEKVKAELDEMLGRPT